MNAERCPSCIAAFYQGASLDVPNLAELWMWASAPAREVLAGLKQSLLEHQLFLTFTRQQGDRTMQLVNDINNNAKAAKKMRLPWWGVLSGIIGSTLSAWLFDHFGRLDLALPTLISIGTLGFAVALRWKLRRHVWFCITMIIIAALHVPLILFVPWTTKWVPAPVLVPFCVADLCAMLAILSVVGKFVEGPKTSER